MRSALLLFLVSASCLCADDTSKAAKVNELLVLTKAEKNVDQMIAQIEGAQKAQLEKMVAAGQDKTMAEDLSVRMRAIVQNHMKWETMRSSYAKLYSDTFTEEELDGMLAFYKSPAGQAVLNKMPLLMQNSVKLGMQAMQDAQPEMQRAIDEVKAKYSK